ncbi:MAG: GatB/YqeY domain-containing protein [Clostridiales bacterium]|jgi:uncharacterized protein YqeY|nr:GatB/YqeY domain-containing protein [Clostridiales bacterium]
MSLKQKLADDIKAAMKEKDSVRRDLIQIVRAGVLQIEKDKKIDALDDDGVTGVILSELKKRGDVLPDYERSGRTEAIAEIKRQMELLRAYLPEQMSAGELEEAVLAAIAETGAASPKDIGRVMAALAPKTKGKADNKAVSEAVKKHLAG